MVFRWIGAGEGLGYAGNMNSYRTCADKLCIGWVDELIPQLRIWIIGVAMCLHSSILLSATSEKIDGTWILDTQATEESVLRNPPYEDVRSFSTELLYMGFTVFEFDGETATAGHLANPYKTKLRRDSIQTTGINYVAESESGDKPFVLTARMLNDGHLSITFSSTPSVRHLLWKRVIIDPNKKRPDDFKPELDAWFLALQNIWKVLEAPPKSNVEAMQ